MLLLASDCDGIVVNIMMYGVMMEMVDGMIRNVIWDMMMNVGMNGMMDGCINVMTSDAGFRFLVHRRLQLLVDG